MSHCPPGTKCHWAWAANQDVMFITLRRCFSKSWRDSTLMEEVSQVVVHRHVFDRDDVPAAQLAHLEELAVDVAGMLRARDAMATLPCALIVRADLDLLRYCFDAK